MRAVKNLKCENLFFYREGKTENQDIRKAKTSPQIDADER